MVKKKKNMEIQVFRGTTVINLVVFSSISDKQQSFRHSQHHMQDVTVSPINDLNQIKRKNI